MKARIKVAILAGVLVISATDAQAFAQQRGITRSPQTRGQVIQKQQGISRQPGVQSGAQVRPSWTNGGNNVQKGNHRGQDGGYRRPGERIESVNVFAIGLTVAPAPIVPQYVAVPNAPGYVYDPANPNVYYVDPNQPPATDATAPIAAPAMVSLSLLNRKSYGVSMNYTVNGTPYTLPSGYVHNLVVPEGATISFNRGEGLQDAAYTLEEAQYEFISTSQGWDIQKMTPPAQ